MTRLPAVRATDAIRALEHAGFVVVRIRGSHHILERPDDSSRRTIIPLHKGKDLPRGLLRKIISDAGLTVAEFADLL